MRKKQITALVCAGVLALMLAGCGKATEESEATGTTDTSEVSTIIGKVTAIDDDKITLELIEEEKSGQEVQSGDQPKGGEKSGEDDSEGADSASADKSDSDTDSQTQESEDDSASSEDGDSGGTSNEGGGDVKTTGESKIITVSKDTPITIDENGKTTTGSIDDIVVDDILTVTMYGNEVKAITVNSMAGASEDGGGDTSGSEDDASEGDDSESGEKSSEESGEKSSEGGGSTNANSDESS